MSVAVDLKAVSRPWWKIEILLVLVGTRGAVTRNGSQANVIVQRIEKLSADRANRRTELACPQIIVARSAGRVIRSVDRVIERTIAAGRAQRTIERIERAAFDAAAESR